MDAVALFCERAADARAGFTLTPDNRAEVAQICARLEGLPLALELAAARVRTVPLAQMAERLDHSLDLLSKGARGADDRQASLRGAISWSHALLNEEEQVLFRRLAVFAGGFTLEAAEGVCAGEGLAPGEVLDRLDGLVDKSLVSLVEQRTSEGRHRLLETIRTYAAEQLRDAGEGLEIADRHAAFYVYVARECAKEGDTVTALDRLEADHPNLLAALDHLSGGDRSIQHGQLVVDLSSVWDVRGQWQLARRELLRYLGRADRDRALNGRCIRGLAISPTTWVTIARPRARFEEGRGIALELDDRRLQSQCVGGLGRVEHELGHFTEARPHFVEALGIARERPWASPESCASAAARANGSRVLGKSPPVSVTTLTPASGLRKLWGMPVRSATAARRGTATVSLAASRNNLGDYVEARAGYGAALATARGLGRRRQEGHWVGCLADLASSLREYPEARERFEEALDIHLELGKEDVELLEAGAVFLARLDRTEEATQLLGAGDNLNQRAHRSRSVGDQARLEAALATCRESLGADGFAAAWERGRALTWESAAAEALGHLRLLRF